MKRIFALVLALCMVFALCACGDGDKDPKTTDNGNETAMKVAMITDYGDITDQSFNQTTWEAVVAFGKDNNVETKYYKPTSNDTAGRVASVELAIAEGYNVIVMPGYAFGGTIVEVAPNYPDVKFVALDVAKGDLLETAVANKGESYDYNPDNWKLEDYVDMSNVYCAIYQEELCGYMAGYAAVKLGYKNLGFLGGIVGILAASLMNINAPYRPEGTKMAALGFATACVLGTLIALVGCVGSIALLGAR